MEKAEVEGGKRTSRTFTRPFPPPAAPGVPPAPPALPSGAPGRHGQDGGTASVAAEGARRRDAVEGRLGEADSNALRGVTLLLVWSERANAATTLQASAKATSVASSSRRCSAVGASLQARVRMVFMRKIYHIRISQVTLLAKTRESVSSSGDKSPRLPRAKAQVSVTIDERLFFLRMHRLCPSRKPEGRHPT